MVDYRSQAAIQHMIATPATATTPGVVWSATEDGRICVWSEVSTEGKGRKEEGGRREEGGGRREEVQLDPFKIGGRAHSFAVHHGANHDAICIVVAYCCLWCGCGCADRNSEQDCDTSVAQTTGKGLSCEVSVW